MSISYEGIGEWCATFVCGAVSEGDIVKVSANGTVGTCTAARNAEASGAGSTSSPGPVTRVGGTSAGSTRA